MENEVKYFSFGEGKQTFVILPGASIRPVILNRAVIEGSYAAFASNYTIYLFDYLKSVHEGSTIESISEDVADKMKELGIKDAYVLGCSMGGCIAQCLAIYHPELVSKILLGSTFSRPNEITNKVLREWEELAQNQDVVALNKSIQRVNYSKEFYEKFKAAFQAMENEGSPEELARFVHVARALMNVNIYDRLDKIKCKVFVMGSFSDETVGSQASIEIAQKIKCPLHLYAKYGHCVYDEAPDYKERIELFFEGKIT